MDLLEPDIYPMTSRNTFFLLLFLLLAGCAKPVDTPLPTSGPVVVATIAATQTPASPPATRTPAPPSPSATAVPETPAPSLTPTVSPTPTPATGSVSGKVCYRASQIPAMTAYFQESDTGDVTELELPAGQNTYTAELPPGTYIAYAWLPDFSLGGLYSNAISCGLKPGCSDHSPVTFQVAAGEKIEGVDLCDWYAFDVPLPPGRSEDQTRSTISGRVEYPGSPVPGLHVVAFNRTSGYWYFVLTLPDQPHFTLRDMPPGEYVIAAYTREGQAGGYTEGGKLKPIILRAGENDFIVISDWSAPEGTFPEDPTDW